jgi:hypothetical protein
VNITACQFDDWLVMEFELSFAQPISQVLYQVIAFMR